MKIYKLNDGKSLKLPNNLISSMYKNTLYMRLLSLRALYKCFDKYIFKL